MRGKESLEQLNLPKALREVCERCPALTIFESEVELHDSSCGGPGNDEFEVSYPLPDGSEVVEAVVSRVRNGISANYIEPYMRRRDPDCMVVADDLPSDKPRYKERFGEEFDTLQKETYEWLAGQELAVFAFHTGRTAMGMNAVAVAPANAAFFALGLAMLQGIKPLDALEDDFEPQVIIYVAPPFRHTHFDGKQMVVHNRSEELHEVYSYNLYPGPSAKKGIYGTLIRQGETEGWVAAHCSAVEVITPYDNTITIMHEGASGGGKSEMLEQPHRLPDGRLLKGRNTVTGEERYLEITRTCELRPVADDMALCHPSIQKKDGRLWLIDAENAWFLRVNHITEYGTDHDLEKLTIKPVSPLLFLNIDAVPQSRALIWEHIEDEPGKRCPNPRVVVPRRIIPGIVNREVAVDIRSIGLRTPPCTRENPSYGIMGMFHILPPALGWLWRLVAPRGYANPSIVASDKMESEGVGSYWPFATGRRVEQANLLLRQIEQTPRTRYILTPNQHVGAWFTGFMPQWLARDYLARRGTALYHRDRLTPARCPLLGYALRNLRIEGASISNWFLQVDTQPEVGEEAYDAGAEMLREFFRENLKVFLQPGISTLGRWIIECFMDDGSLSDYEKLMPENQKHLFEVETSPRG